jgi:hypothetical protein
MKPLGIVLLFINLLAAAGVAYLATQSWAKRQEQNTAILKYELPAIGMPTNKGPAVPSNPEETYKVGTRDVRVKILTELFAGAGRGGDYSQLSGVPGSVVGEVEDLKRLLDAKLNEQPNAAAKLQFLVGVPSRTVPGRLEPGPLTLLADDFEERNTYREWAAEAAKPQNANPAPVLSPDELFALARAALDAKFDLITAAPSPSANSAFEAAKLTARQARDKAFDDFQKAAKGPGQADLQKAYNESLKQYWTALSAKSASLSESDRRRRAAGLLSVLDPSASGQKRTALLVGLSDYTAAILERTQRLSAMPERYERQGEAELAAFLVVYQGKLATSRDLDRMLQKQANITRGFATQQKKAEELVLSRTKHRDDAQGRVNDIDAKTKATAATQAELEREILQLQRLVGARFDELFQLEDQVFAAEKQKAK